MSELTECNFCMLRDIKRRAKAAGRVVHLVACSDNATSPFGIDVLVCPPNVEPDREKHFAAWMWEISNACVC